MIFCVGEAKLRSKQICILSMAWINSDGDDDDEKVGIVIRQCYLRRNSFQTPILMPTTGGLSFFRRPFRLRSCWSGLESWRQLHFTCCRWNFTRARLATLLLKSSSKSCSCLFSFKFLSLLIQFDQCFLPICFSYYTCCCCFGCLL